MRQQKKGYKSDVIQVHGVNNRLSIEFPIYCRLCHQLLATASHKSTAWNVVFSRQLKSVRSKLELSLNSSPLSPLSVQTVSTLQKKKKKKP